jgi:hypothetical protein
MYTEDKSIKIYLIWLLYLSVAQQVKTDVALLIVEVRRSHTISQTHPVRLI